MLSHVTGLRQENQVTLNPKVTVTLHRLLVEIGHIYKTMLVNRYQHRVPETNQKYHGMVSPEYPNDEISWSLPNDAQAQSFPSLRSPFAL